MGGIYKGSCRKWMIEETQQGVLKKAKGGLCPRDDNVIFVFILFFKIGNIKALLQLLFIFINYYYR